MNAIDLDVIPARIYRKDLQGRFTFANLSCVRELGCQTLKELLGKTDFDFFQSTLASKWRSQEESLIESRSNLLEQVEEEIWIDRDPTWVQTTKRIEYDELGAPISILGISYDITANYLAYLRYHDAVEGHQDGVWQFDAKSRRLWLSRRCLEILGRPEGHFLEETAARDILDIVDVGDRERAKHLYQMITFDENSGEFDCRVRRSDGVMVPVRIRLTATFEDPAQYPSKLSGSISDRTDSYMQESYRAFLDLVPNFIFVKDREFRFTFVNKAIAEGFGKSPSDILGKTDNELNPNVNQVASFRRDDEEVLLRGYAKPIPEEVFDHITLGKRVLKTIKIPLPSDEHGTSDGLVGVSTDITELWETRQYLETLMENIPDGVFFKDSQHSFTRVNRAMADYLGAKHDTEVLGKTDSDFFPEDQASSWEEEERSLFRTGESVSGDVRLTRAKGRLQWRSVSKSPVSDPDGNVVGIVGITHDLTDERKTQALLSTVLDEIPFLVTLQDLHGTYLLCNRAFAEHVGADQKQIMGQGPNILPDPFALRKIMPEFERAVKGIAYTLEDHIEQDYARNSQHFSLQIFPVFDEENGKPKITSILTIRDPLSRLYVKQQDRHHAHLELLNWLRNEEVSLRQHFLLLLGLTHVSSFGFNRAVSWQYRISEPNELVYVHSIGQPSHESALNFSKEFQHLETWSLQQCLQDFDQFRTQRDSGLAGVVKQHRIIVNSGGRLETALTSALRNDTVMIEVVQNNGLYSELKNLFAALDANEALLCIIPFDDCEISIVVCDNIRTRLPIEGAVGDAGNLRYEINDFLRSAQTSIAAAKRQASERERLSKEEASRQVAHEFSHILGNILPFTLEAVQRVAMRHDDVATGSDLHAIGNDLLRCIDLMEDFKRYSQKVDQWALKREHLDVASVAKRIREYIGGSIPNLRFTLDKDVAALIVEIDLDRLKQECFAALAQNAKAHGGKGDELECELKISLDTAKREIGLGQWRTVRHALFAFSDNGNGVRHELKQKIFEPLVTTDKDRGTGLGLSIAKRVVELLGGTIDEVGTLGTGAVFRIFLATIENSTFDN